MIRLLVLDVEGVITLPGGGQFPWPLEDLLGIRSFLASTPLATVLCTGRQQPYGEAVIQALNLFSPLLDAQRAGVRARGGPELLSWPSIMENGAYFYDPLAKRPIPHPGLSAERIQRLQRLRGEVLVPLANRTGAVVEAGKDFSLSLNPPPVAPGSSERQPIEGFGAQVREVLGEYAADVEVKYSASAVDITPQGVSKASAVRLLLEWTGLDPQEVLGVGDTRADEAWLAEVGWRATPANGRANLPGMHFYAEGAVAAGLLEILHHAASRGFAGPEGSMSR
ncbi:MAG: HAD-superfamily hydrolase [Armatimonadetes bacterium]|nr:HAD-superfamily hydrolase [Armatimonadota bacterium]